MISLIKLLSPKLCSNTSFNILKSSIFTETKIKIDHFRKEKKFFEQKHASDSSKY
jgi:hypothetical protein